jgi:RNA polymerase sigma factor (sigma-70 family)
MKNSNDVAAARALAKLHDNPTDELAWAEFISQVSAPLLLYLVRMCGDRDLSKDMLQDVFMRFFEYRGVTKVTDINRAMALLRVMARNRLIDHFRSMRKIPLANTDTGMTAVPDPSPESNPSESHYVRANELERLAGQLSKQDRILLHKVLAGTDVGGIAKALEITYSTAAVRLSRLKARLRRISQLDVYT